MKIIKWQKIILLLMAYEKQIHLVFTYKVITWHSVHASLLRHSSHLFSFFFINSFIASLFLFWYLSHTLFLCTSLKQLLSLSIYRYLSFTLRIAVILLLFLHISLSHLFSVSLTQPLTVVHFMFVTVFLSFFHSCYDMIIIIIVFVFVLITVIF